MGDDETVMEYIIWLQLVMNYGNNRVSRVFACFKDAKAVFTADRAEREKSGAFTRAELDKMDKLPLSKAQEILNKCRKLGIAPIAIGDKDFPVCLSAIENPPLVIYVKGKLPDFDDTPSICVVGPRNVSDFGKRAAFSLASRLSRAGFIIVSGGAVGSDTYAHSGALKFGGVTVLVMGCGINYGYLKENAELRDKVVKNGCLISEYPPDTPASPYNFPVRNRIMSALCVGTVVIEAHKKSGALITAAHANNQGRDVFVIPGSPENKAYEGSNALLRDGAKPLLDASDIFNEYIVRFPDKINIEKAFEKPSEEKENKNKPKLLPEGLSKEAKIVYNHLNGPKFYPEDIKDTGLSDDELISALTELEISLVIRAKPGGQYEIVDR